MRTASSRSRACRLTPHSWTSSSSSPSTSSSPTACSWWCARTTSPPARCAPPCLTRHRSPWPHTAPCTRISPDPADRPVHLPHPQTHTPTHTRPPPLCMRAGLRGLRGARGGGTLHQGEGSQGLFGEVWRPLCALDTGAVGPSRHAGEVQGCETIELRRWRGGACTVMRGGGIARRHRTLCCAALVHVARCMTVFAPPPPSPPAPHPLPRSRARRCRRRWHCALAARVCSR